MAQDVSYPIDTLCKLLDLTPRRVQQLTAEGVLIKVERGRYDLVRSVRGYVKYLRDRALKSDMRDGDESINASKQRKIKAEAELAELDLMERQGELVRTEDVAKRWNNLGAVVRTNILAVSSIAAPQCEGQTASAIETIIAQQIDDALENISTDTGKKSC